MEVQFYGGNCVRITTKKASFVIDDTLKDLGSKPVTKDGDIAIFTDATIEPPAGNFAITGPGEYEIAEVSVYGIAAQRHTDEPGTKQSTIYRLVTTDFTVAVVGNAHPDISDEQLENLGMIDVLFIPIGGHGLTIDPVGALRLIKKIEPKIIIPTHYANKNLKYPVPQMDLEAALKEMNMEPSRTEAKLKLKPADLPAQTQLWVLQP